MSVAHADFNADRKEDVVVAFNSGPGIGLELGHGDGTFGAPITKYVSNGSPIAVAAADLDRDGHADVLVGSDPAVGAATVCVLQGQGDGGFAVGASYGVSSPNSLVVDDFNGDQALDFAVASRNSGEVSIFFGSGDGGFQLRGVIRVAGSPRSLVAADLNGDNRPELVLVNLGSGTASVLWNHCP